MCKSVLVNFAGSFMLGALFDFSSSFVKNIKNFFEKLLHLS
jgi:flagellar biosynthesis protein FliQ